MSIMHFILTIAALNLMALGACGVSAQTFPSKPIRIITAEPGGSHDFATRIIAHGISEPLGQQIVIDNRGGSTILLVELLLKSPGDGYTLIYNGSVVWLLPLMRDKVPYDPIKDLVPVTLVASSPNVLVVHPSVPVRSVKELIAAVKGSPSGFNYASGIDASSSHLAGELFKHLAGVNIVRIPYKGSGPAVIGIISGQVQLGFISPPSVTAHIKTGALRALAVTSAEPSDLLLGLPTIAASGLPGYEFATIQGILAPAKTPAAIVDRLHREISRVVNRADVKEKFLKSGADPVAGSPQQFAAAIRSENSKMGKVIRDIGIRVE